MTMRDGRAHAARRSTAMRRDWTTGASGWAVGTQPRRSGGGPATAVPEGRHRPRLAQARPRGRRWTAPSSTASGSRWLAAW